MHKLCPTLTIVATDGLRQRIGWCKVHITMLQINAPDAMCLRQMKTSCNADRSPERFACGKAESSGQFSSHLSASLLTRRWIFHTCDGDSCGLDALLLDEWYCRWKPKPHAVTAQLRDTWLVTVSSIASPGSTLHGRFILTSKRQLHASAPSASARFSPDQSRSL